MTARPTFIAWRGPRSTFGAWHRSAGGGRTSCGLSVPAGAAVSTTHRPASLCSGCQRATLAELASPAPVTGAAAVSGTYASVTCENRWRARPGSPGFCTKPAVGLYRRPDVLGGNLNLCHDCALFLYRAGGGIAYRLGEPRAKEPTP